MSTLADRIRKSLQISGKKQIELAKACRVTKGAITQWVNGSTKALEGENLLNAAQFLGVSARWLQTGEGPMQGNASPQPLPAIATEANIVSIPQFDAGGRMGNGGLILQDQPGLIRSWDVSREWLTQNVKGVSGNSKLCIVTGFGDSMKPMFNPGDPLLVDLSVHTVDYDAVYFFRVGHEGFIKRIQRIPGQGIRAISANRDHYEPWTITEDMDFEVLGRVLKVWKGDDF